MRRKTYHKRKFPIANVRRFLEPGPIVLVSSAYQREQNIMTMGWHMVMEYSPSRLGCFITGSNHSFELIKKSKELVINIPTLELKKEVVLIGNCSGTDVDKFEEFNLTAVASQKVKAPSIQECFANIECVIEDSSQINKYNLFILKVVAAHVATSPKFPKTLHYRGEGLFMTSGPEISMRKYFKPEML